MCVGFRATLYYSAPVPGASLQWQSSPNSLVWANVPQAVAPVYVTPTITNTPVYYRVRVVCGTSSRFSNAYQAVPVLTRCYCRPPVNSNGCTGLSRLGRVWVPTTPLDVPPGTCADQADDAGRILGLYPGSQTATLQRGATYQLNAVVPAQQLLYGWIDYNGDGILGNPGEALAFSYSGPGGTLAQAIFTVPATAQLGITGLRLRLNVFSSGPSNSYACQGQGNGETLDLLVTLAPPSCAGAALQGGLVRGPRTYCPSTVPPVSVLFQTPGAALQWQTSPDSLVWTNVPGAQAAQLSGPATWFQDSLYVRVGVRCGLMGPVAYSPAVYLLPDPQLCFCVLSSSYAGSPETELGTVRVGNTPLVSTLSPRYYNTTYRLYPPAVPANTATLLTGISYPLVLQPPFAFTGGLVPYVMGWLDANNNGRFAAAEGTLLQARTSTPYRDSVATLTVPATAVPGGRTRLRTQSRDRSLLFTGDTQCYTSNQTEVRDFLVTVAPSAPSSLPLTAGLVQGLSSSGIISNYPGQRVRLSVVGYSRGATLQWQQQMGSGAWQAVPNATSAVLLSGALTGVTSFRVEARLGTAAPVVSPAVLVSPTGPCPCNTNLRGQTLSNGLWGAIRSVTILGKGAYFINRSNAAPPFTNGSVYTDYSLLNDSLHLNLYRGQLYWIEVEGIWNNTGAPCEVQVWMDYNSNGVYEASERVALNPSNQSGVRFTVPATTSLGPVRMRVRSRGSSLPPTLQAGDACRSLDFNDYGETEDYTFTVADPPAFQAPEITTSGALVAGGTVQLGTRPALPTGTVLVWEGPVGFVSTQAQPTLSNLTAAHSGYYYLTARTASGSYQLTAARHLQIGQGLATELSKPGGAAISLYPNPTTGAATLHFDAASPDYNLLRVLSSTGQVIYTRALNARDQSADLPLDLRTQPRGLYLVQIVGPAGIISRKLLLE